MSAQSQPSTSGRLPWILLALVLIVWGWQSFSPYWFPLSERIVTTENYTALQSEVKNDTAMSDVDKSAFLSASSYEKSIQPYGKTVGQVIEESRAKDIAYKKASEEKALVKKELTDDIEIRPYSLVVKKGRSEIIPSMDEPWNDIDEIEFSIINKGPKTIKSFIANATLTNEGGDEIFSGQLSSADILAPGHRTIIHIDHKPIIYEGDHARATTIEKTIVHYSTTHIWYSDGSEAVEGF
jgi:hypothetical protein